MSSDGSVVPMNWLLAAMALVLLMVSASDADEGERIWQGLLSAPPTVPQTDRRTEAVRALDEFIEGSRER